VNADWLTCVAAGIIWRSGAEEEHVVAGAEVEESTAGRERGDQGGADPQVQDHLTRLTDITRASMFISQTIQI